MAAPTIIFVETNGASPGTTTPASPITGGSTGVTNVVFANQDTASPSLTPGISNAVAAGANSYEKWWRVAVTAIATNGISNFGVSYSATLPQDGGGSTSTLTLTTSTVNNLTSYVTPVATTSTQGTPHNTTGYTSLGAVPLTAPANTVGSLSSFWVMQLQVASNATGGNVVFGNPLITCQYTYA